MNRKFTTAACTLAVVAAATALLWRPAISDEPAAPTTKIVNPAKDVLINSSDAVLLLIDHQTGLFQTVKDIGIAELRANTVALMRVAKLAKVPIITTASVPDGPNGPLMSEIAVFAPDAIYVPRKGEISSWDNEDFVKAVEKTGKKTLIIAGVWTSVCVAFPALQAKAAGYNVYFVPDASGDPSVMTSQTTMARMAQAGIVPISTNAIVCELQRTWNRPDAAEWGAVYPTFAPNYGAAMESYERAKNVGAKSKE